VTPAEFRCSTTPHSGSRRRIASASFIGSGSARFACGSRTGLFLFDHCRLEHLSRFGRVLTRANKADRTRCAEDIPARRGRLIFQGDDCHDLYESKYIGCPPICAKHSPAEVKPPRRRLGAHLYRRRSHEPTPERLEKTVSKNSYTQIDCATGMRRRGNNPQQIEGSLSYEAGGDFTCHQLGQRDDDPGGRLCKIIGRT
jgi:hypothetical protein